MKSSDDEKKDVEEKVEVVEDKEETKASKESQQEKSKISKLIGEIEKSNKKILKQEKEFQKKLKDLSKEIEDLTNVDEIKQKVGACLDKVTESIEKEKTKVEKKIHKAAKEDISQEKRHISIWRVFAYFIIYSVVGYIIETIFGLFNAGVWESRQSFLYGPFCSIYGVGAVIIILVLNYKFFKNNHTLFLGGFIVGTIVEYFVSLFGEMLLGVKWWDYSDRFLNIGGRVCLLFSFFWGLLGVYLMRVVNPKVDKFIDWLKTKVNYTFLKVATLGMIIFMFLDCCLSAYAINVFLIRVAHENDLPVKDRTKVEQLYDELYNDEEKSRIIEKYFSVEKMMITYPRLTITMEDGSFEMIYKYYPDVKRHYYEFNTAKSI